MKKEVNHKNLFVASIMYYSQWLDWKNKGYRYENSCDWAMILKKNLNLRVDGDYSPPGEIVVTKRYKWSNYFVVRVGNVKDTYAKQ